MVSEKTNHKENPMTYETEYTLLEDIIQMLTANGDNGFFTEIIMVKHVNIYITRNYLA